MARVPSLTFSVMSPREADQIMVVCLLGVLRCVVRQPRYVRQSTLSLLAREPSRSRLYTLRRSKRISSDSPSPTWKTFVIDMFRVSYDVLVLNKTCQGLFHVQRDWGYTTLNRQTFVNLC